MSSLLFLSRARLRRDAPASALRPVLALADESARVAAGHRLVWTLFADAPERQRDFLWREAEPGVFYLLSRRQPVDRHGLFEVDEPKPFAPSLALGDRLAFALRANATVARGGGPGRRGKPCDVVMDALRGVPPGERAAERGRVIDTAGRAWLRAQGDRSGFSIAPEEETTVLSRENVREQGTGLDGEQGAQVRVVAYRTVRLERTNAPAMLGVLDLEGVLEVRDPVVFVEALGHGFGRAKAFGCGLMLVRRA